eukprot:13308195-Ditylum_brightwellii.AAC.1
MEQCFVWHCFLVLIVPSKGKNSLCSCSITGQISTKQWELIDIVEHGGHGGRRGLGHTVHTR